jgi:hypothetical protein
MSTSVQNLAGSGFSSGLPPASGQFASGGQLLDAADYSDLLKSAAELFESMGYTSLVAEVSPAIDLAETDLKGGAIERPLFNQDGAPALLLPGTREPKWQVFSPEALMMLVDAMRIQANNILVNGQTNNAERETKLRVDKYEEAQQKKIKEFQEACESYAKRSGWAKFFGGAFKILGPIALAVGIVGAILSGGALSPLLIGIAAISLGGTALQAAGISVADKVSSGASDLLCMVGVPKDTAGKIGNIAAGCTAIIDPSGLGKAFRGAGELMGASGDLAGKLETIGTVVAVAALTLLTIVLTFGAGALNAASTASSKVAGMAAKFARLAREVMAKVGDAGKIARVANGFRLGVNGVTAVAGIGSTGLNMAVADSQMDISSAQADRRLLQRLVEYARQDLGLMQDAMKRDLDFLVNNLKASTDMISQYSQASIERARSLGGPV